MSAHVAAHLRRQRAVEAAWMLVLRLAMALILAPVFLVVGYCLFKGWRALSCLILICCFWTNLL